MRFFSQLFIGIAIVAFSLYAYIEKHNQLTALRIEVPILTKKLKSVEEENTRLQYEIEKFENPLNLMQLARKPQFGHLKHPYTNDIIQLKAIHAE